MQLSNCELLPGVIVDSKDPLKLGRIKCVIPGYVDAGFSNENMPWIRPLGMFNHQSFSKMMNGCKVWVVVNKSNYNEYWYFPLFELNDVAKNYLESVYDNDQPEILIAHNCGGNHALLTYDESNGFSMKIGQYQINLHPNGKITLLGGSNGIVEIDGGKVKIGKEGGTDEPAVLGNKLMDILKEMKSGFADLASKSPNNPYTAPLTSGFTTCLRALEKYNTIKSDNITVN